MSYPPYPGDPQAAEGFPRYGPTAAQGERPPLPPGYYYPPQPEPAHGLMIAAIVMASLVTAVQVIEAGLAWPAQHTYLEAADNGTRAYDVWTPYDLAALPQFPLLIAAYVVTCLWLYKVRTNYEAFFPGAHLARSKGWVWGSWVCPVVNLWFPFQIVRDISRDPRQFSGSAVLGWWWALWLITRITDQIGPALVTGSEIDTGAVSALGIMETIDASILVGAFVLWLAAVRRIGRLQDQLMGFAR
ncbi:DUF4328 domain-containing protein [Aeromicrobium ginsengisoli]|uniref:DUF4328 domain-containing protein n=1 Tax=Aeromicrobium ginsengisoli TaxID=363867 RepID=A0A5M4FBT7_9ACTN|nr:DUF4328 domain-containing protein [Aeromicrobium ginsengisoli]KAA1395370.1 DUF4328 domain-containing protein [Aeromicrobium ginsengisoli]